MHQVTYISSTTCQLSTGLIVAASAKDPLKYLIDEIVVRQAYTHNDFYVPKPDDRILDIGANIGVLCLYAFTLERRLRVHCFEPMSDTRRRLEYNISANGLTENVIVHPFAIAGTSGPRTFYKNGSSGNSSVFCRQVDDGVESVNGITLAEAIVRADRGQRIDFLKLDIEGVECEALVNAQDVDWDRVRCIALECHDFLVPGACARVCQMVDRYGFDIVDVIADPNSPYLMSVVRARRPR